MWRLCVAVLAVCLHLSHEDIRLPPSITKGPTKQPVIYRSDDSVTLECIAKGVPEVTYGWKKNGFELNQNLQNIHKGADGTITIQPATSLDQGFYQCFAKNQYGTAISTTTHMQKAYLESAPGTPSTFQKSVQEGQPFYIQAEPKKSFPKSAYGWEIAISTVDKNPAHLRPSRRIQIAENGDLYFAYALPEDDIGGKLYKCTVYNSYLDVKAGGSYTKLTVTRNAAGITPFLPSIEFSSEAETVALIGGSVTLRCFFNGYPVPSISWSGPRNTLPIGRYTLNIFNTELTIVNISASDEGDYACYASNTQGRISHRLQIRVEAVPSFPTLIDGPRDINVTEGESVTFNCKADAKPEATIIWMENGNILNPDNPPRRFVFSNDLISLKIIDVCRDCVDREIKTDLMVIQCNASNVHGYAFASGYLNVLSRTVVTIHNETEVQVNATGEGRVQFDCRATSDPSTPPTIRWFKVEETGDRLLYSEPPFLTINSGLLSIHVAANVAEYWPKYLGQYRCVAATGHSKVDKTATITGISAFVEENAANDYTWIWICIGVVGFLIVLIGFFCALCKRPRNRKDERNSSLHMTWHAGNVGKPDSREGRGAASREKSYPYYETIVDDAVVSLEVVQVLDVGCGHNQSKNTVPVGATESNRSLTVDSTTQTDNSELECRCGQPWISPPELRTRGSYTTLNDRDLVASSTYATVQLA